MINLFKKMFMLFLCTFFPWLVLLINNNPGGAILSLILQVTLIGWPFASVWAWRVQYPTQKETAE